MMGICNSNIFTEKAPRIRLRFTSKVFSLSNDASYKHINYSTKNQLLDLFPTIIVVSITMVVVYLFQLYFNPSNLVLQIVVSSIVCISTFIFISESTKLSPYIVIKQLIIDQIKK